MRAAWRPCGRTGARAHHQGEARRCGVERCLLWLWGLWQVRASVPETERETMSPAASAGAGAVPGGMAGKQEAVFAEQSPVDLPYLLYTPAEWRSTDVHKWPLLVFLHGQGGRARLTALSGRKFVRTHASCSSSRPPPRKVLSGSEAIWRASRR